MYNTQYISTTSKYTRVHGLIENALYRINSKSIVLYCRKRGAERIVKFYNNHRVAGP